jgi:hypothetical protein
MGKEYAGELQLASKGHFYGDAFPDGIMHVEPWGTEEERLLVSPNVNHHESLDRLITRLTDCPLPPGDLLLVDRQHVFFYMRCLSYGGDYTYNYQCENESCGEKATQDIDLEKLDVTYVDSQELLEAMGVEGVDQIEEPFRFKLPIQEKEVAWRMLRGKDEREVDKYVRRMTKKARKGASRDERSDYIYRLALRISEVDGQKMAISDSMEFVRSLKGKDALAIRQEIEVVDFGIDTELTPTCPHCGFENEIILPRHKSFFRPKRRVAQGH